MSATGIRAQPGAIIDDAGGATLGLFADGPVGEQVLALLLERCPERLSYVVACSPESPVARLHGRIGADVPLLIWSDSAAQTLPRLAGAAPEIVLLAWWPHIVRAPFLSAGQSATLNMHPSLLPYGRGKDPNFWALAEDEPYGATIHHVDEGVDTGDIAFQRRLDVSWEDTGATLYHRAMALLIEMLESSLDAILSLNIPRISQGGAGPSARTRARLEPRSTLDLDADTTWREMLNLLRARTFPPFPGCRFTDATGTYQVRVQIDKIED